MRRARAAYAGLVVLAALTCRGADARADEPPRSGPPGSPGEPAHRRIGAGIMMAFGAPLAVAWFFPAWGCALARFPNNSIGMVLPVAGPWITLALRDNAPEPLDSIARGFLWADGVVQGVGLAGLLVGAIVHNGTDATGVRLNRLRLGPSVPELEFAPFADGAGSVGLAVTGVLGRAALIARAHPRTSRVPVP